ELQRGKPMTLTPRHVLILAASLAAAAAASPIAAAQTYPSHPVRVIVPAAPGGPSDLIGRIIAQKLAEAWGQQFVVENIPTGTVKELIALVRANPGKYSYASPGTGTTGQLAGELFRLSLGLDLVHVPFNGGAPAATSTIGGHTPIMFAALPTAATAIKDGKLR